MSRPDEKAGAPRGDVTELLSEVSRGIPQSEGRLLRVVYDELRRIAAVKMGSQGSAHTLQPTALVHEAYLRLLGGAPSAAVFRDRVHFFSAAATAMRSILVDHARRRCSEKRGGPRAHVALHPDLVGEADTDLRILQIHEVLERFTAMHARAARVVELLFFAGLSVAEAASALGVSDRTVKRDWRFGRAWLLREMGEE